MTKKEDSKHAEQGKAPARAAADVESLQQQIAEMTEALQRERADATNLRRRHDEQHGRSLFETRHLYFSFRATTCRGTTRVGASRAGSGSRARAYRHGPARRPDPGPVYGAARD